MPIYEEEKPRIVYSAPRSSRDLVRAFFTHLVLPLLLMLIIGWLSEWLNAPWARPWS